MRVVYRRRPWLYLVLAHCLVQSSAAATLTPPRLEGEPPRIKALLEQAWAAEGGRGQLRDEVAAASLYCEAARYGSAEGHYRSALIHLRGPEGLRDPVLAKSFLVTAVELGKDEAAAHLAPLESLPLKIPGCLVGDNAYLESARFNFRSHVAALGPSRRLIAHAIMRLAPEYGIDQRLALAIAGVESNFDQQARSPKNAQGVMQLIPETAERFGVKNPYDAEQNIRGGLAYLRWLKVRFRGDLPRVVAAYNAGEGAVDRYGGIPPYVETRAYVFRVMKFAGLSTLSDAKPAALPLAQPRNGVRAKS